ncbi:hypothetical protein ACWC4D_33785 [Streptomyces sp. NPDC001288]
MPEEQPAPADLCGRTEAVSGIVYAPCVREADHREAFCRNANGDLFLAFGTGRL